MLWPTTRSAAVHRVVRDTVAAHVQAIRERFPQILRRVSGYNLDEFVPGLPVRPVGWDEEPWRFNLARLIVGVGRDAGRAAAAVLKRGAAPGGTRTGGAVVRHDPRGARSPGRDRGDWPGRGRDARPDDSGPGRGKPALRQLSDFADGRPAAVLAAQFYADSPERAGRAGRASWPRGSRAGRACWAFASGSPTRPSDDFWKVRKAGFSLLMGMVGDAKPIAFVEDTAVDPDRLPQFYDRFRADRRTARRARRRATGMPTSAACTSGRSSTSRRLSGVETLRSIAREVSDLVVEYRRRDERRARRRPGPQPLEPQALRARGLRALRDRQARLSTPKTCSTPARSSATPTPARTSGSARTTIRIEPASTRARFLGAGGLRRGRSRCARASVPAARRPAARCARATWSRATRCTRRAGRANAAAAGDDGRIASRATTASTTRPCTRPSTSACNARRARANARPRSTWPSSRRRCFTSTTATGRGPSAISLLGQIFRLEPDRVRDGPAGQPVLRNRVFKWLLEKAAGIDRRRTLPTFARDHFRKWFRGTHASRACRARAAQVVLLDDCFTTYNDPEVGIAAVRVLEAAGYRVDLAGPAVLRPAGDLQGAFAAGPRAGAGRTFRSFCRSLAAGHADCRLRAELPGDAGRRVPRFPAGAGCRRGGERCLFGRRVSWPIPAGCPSLPLAARAGRVLVHGHCQQKAVLGTAGTLAALQRVPGLEIKELDSGCCGMAGSFGYELGHYEMSAALANRVLIPAARSDPRATLVAPGFSCRSQLHGLAGLVAVHPMQVLSDCL